MVKKEQSLRILFILFLLGLFYAQNSLYAREKGSEYEKGSYMRIQTGGGQGIFDLQHLSEKNSRFISNAPFFTFHLGTVVARNFILYGGISTVQALQVESPVKNHTNSSYSYTMLSAGLNYYFMPYNIYISPEIRILGNATLRYQRDTGVKTESVFDSGTGYGFSIAKEWSLREDNLWKLGIALVTYQDGFRGKRNRTTDKDTVTGGSNFDQVRTSFFGLALSLSLHKF